MISGVDQTLAEEMEAAIRTNSLPRLSAAVERSADELDMLKCQEFVNTVLVECVREGKPELANHLLHEGADVTALNAVDPGYKPSIALWEVLKSYDYDFNQPGSQDATYKGKHLIHKVTHEVRLVRWLLEECEVSVDMGEEDYWWKPRPPLLLDYCALLGSVASFKLIKDAGAKVGRRTLHNAVRGAAEHKCDPRSNIDSDIKEGSEEGPIRGLGDLPEEESKRNRVEMLRYLVDELHLDVNGLDTIEREKPSCWGPPIQYALRTEGGEQVVQWLLEKGADPDLKW